MRPVSEQVTLFALMVTMGMILGIIFDFYRALRGIAEPGKIITIIGDIAFWLIATALVFAVLMWKTWGEMRAYVLIGLLVGFIIHWYYFSPFIIKFFRSVIFFIIWIAKVVWRIISWPFITAKSMLTIPILYAIGLSKAGKKYVHNKRDKYRNYVSKKKNKCRNFVINKLKSIFKRPPEND